MKLFLLIGFILSFEVSLAKTPDWSAEAKIPLGQTRADIYGYGDQLEEVIREGQIMALKWPVEVTGLLVPYEPLKYFLEAPKNPLRTFIERIAEGQLGFNNLEGMYRWLGLNIYPENDSVPDVFQIPYPTEDELYPDFRMGASIIDSHLFPQSKGLTFSCATCHSGTFLGKSVMGLTNKRPRANEFFVLAKKYIPLIPSQLFQSATHATEEERLMFARTKENLAYVGSVSPQVLGLDTSLPHVALSLHKRKDDAYASKKPLSRRERRDRGTHKLQNFVADSKPMPWWNLKYKTRWLSDGSVVAGNPILTNFLWNEIGRGTDLEKLEQWMQNNQDKIEKVTAMAFANKAPRWTDFFPESSIDLAAAQRGEKVFNQSCKHCHGQYLKKWSEAQANNLSVSELIETTKVVYHESTPVKNVGTDPQRWQATETFANGLNKLAISQWMKTKVEPQKGYVPPPLEGIFLRYPYFHNNSIPNLCALMQKEEDRPKEFVQGPSLVVSDYDQECLGYPIGESIPQAWWQQKDAIFDTTKPGLRNIGHTKMFWDQEGNALHSPQQRKDLLMYLKTL